MKKITLALAVILLAAACSKKLSPPSQTDVDRGAKKFPGYTLAELNEGKSIYEANCNTCHDLKNPRSFSETEWNKLVPDMVTKVNHKAKQEVLSQDKQQLILKYVLTMGPLSK